MVRKVEQEVRSEGSRVTGDYRPEKIGSKIRDAQLEKVPFVVVYGERESRDALAVRRHHGEQTTQSLDELAGEIAGAATI